MFSETQKTDYFKSLKFRGLTFQRHFNFAFFLAILRFHIYFDLVVVLQILTFNEQVCSYFGKSRKTRPQYKLTQLNFHLGVIVTIKSLSIWKFLGLLQKMIFPYILILRLKQNFIFSGISILQFVNTGFPESWKILESPGL